MHEMDIQDEILNVKHSFFLNAKISIPARTYNLSFLVMFKFSQPFN
jgi:hypothetical protein